MANIAVSRVKREFQEVQRSDYCGIKLELVNDSFMNLRGEITGPPDTPYEQGEFILDILIPVNYPFSPPKVKFLTKIWHSNVSSVTGAICLDILKNAWAPTMSLRSVLLSIQALMSSAEPNDPLDAVVAAQYKTNLEMFGQTAKHWTNAYAKGPHKNPDFDEKIQFLQGICVNEVEARAILSRHNWDLNRAVDQLLK